MSFKVAPRETIVKCTAYDNKFRAYPEEVKLKMARIEKARIDSKETEAMRYERLMTQKFLAGHFVVESPRLALLAKVGKALLIVALFPPFFIFVTFPRYTFETLLPKLYAKAEEPIVKLAKNIAWISQWSIDIFNVALGKVARKLKINFPRIELPRIKLKMPETVTRAVKKPFQIAFKLGEITVDALNALKNKIASLASPIQKTFAQAVDKTELFFEKIEEKMALFANFFKAAPPPVRAYGQKDPVPLWKEKFFERKEAVEKIIASVKDTLAAPFIALISRLEPVVNFVSSYIPMITHQVQAGYESLARAIKSRIDAVSEMATSAYKKVETAIISLSSAVIESINTFLTPYYPIPGRIIRSASKATNKIKSNLFRKVRAVLSFGSALKEHARSFKKTIVKALKKAPALAEKAMQKMVHFGINLLKALKSFFIILGVTIKILYIYIRDLNNRIVNRNA